jgi:arylsulfatase A-like enzyme
VRLPLPAREEGLKVGLLALLALAACEGEPPPPPRVVVLVSLDTTRADALSCYADQNHWGLAFPADSRPLPATPVLDALAADGVRFAWPISHSPTTLSSHTTLLSGRDSHRHGVPRNGYPVAADLPLLPARLQAAGWDTIAVIGSSALERKMGLDRGFSVYDDPGPQPPGGMFLRPATEVTDRALAAVEARAADPARAGTDLFLFVHYYDAHMPWFTAPAETVARFTRPEYAGPVDGSMDGVAFLTRSRRAGTLKYGDARQARGMYLAQVAYTDAEVGRLLEGLAARVPTADRLVVVTADHGEVLDEDADHPYTHGPSTALEALHVPLVVTGTGRLDVPDGVVVERPVRLQDVASTVLARVGIPEVMGDGFDLAPLWRGAPLELPPAFAEASRPMNLERPDRWNNALMERAVFGRDAYLRVRPAERGLATLHRLAPGSPALPDAQRIRTMADLLVAWDATAPPWVPPAYDDATRRALEALGYLDPATPGAAGGGSAGPDETAAEAPSSLPPETHAGPTR